MLVGLLEHGVVEGVGVDDEAAGLAHEVTHFEETELAVKRLVNEDEEGRGKKRGEKGEGARSKEQEGEKKGKGKGERGERRGEKELRREGAKKEVRRWRNWWIPQFTPI